MGHRNCRPHSMRMERMLPTQRQQMLTKFIFIFFLFLFFPPLASPSHLPSLTPMRCSPLPVSVDACMRMGLRRTSFCPSHSLSPCIYLLSFRACACGSDGGVFHTQATDRRIFLLHSHIKLRFKKMHVLYTAPRDKHGTPMATSPMLYTPPATLPQALHTLPYDLRILPYPFPYFHPHSTP